MLVVVDRQIAYDDAHLHVRMVAHRIVGAFGMKIVAQLYFFFRANEAVMIIVRGLRRHGKLAVAKLGQGHEQLHTQRRFPFG